MNPFTDTTYKHYHLTTLMNKFLQSSLRINPSQKKKRRIQESHSLTNNAVSYHMAPHILLANDLGMFINKGDQKNDTFGCRI